MTELAASPVAIVCIAILLLAAIILGRRIELQIGSLHAELKPNGGSSTRDVIDRIEKKADRAVSRAEDAAVQAYIAAQSAAGALERIESIEKANAPAAVAVVVAPPNPPEVA